MIQLKNVTFILFLLLVFGGGVGAQAIDRPAATVRLTKLDVISVRQLRDQIQLLEQQSGQSITLDQRVDVLELLVAEKLITQAAERDRVVVTPSEINARIDELKAQNARALNLDRPLTEQEFRNIVAQTGLQWDEYRTQLSSAMLQQRYVTQAKTTLFERAAAPGEAAVREFYDENKTQLFVLPDMVRFKHIYIDTRNLTTPEARNQARVRADSIFRELSNGGDYDELVVRYSDDDNSRYTGGVFGNGYLRRDDRNTQQLVGRPFFDTVFRMSEGDTSGVLDSNLGLHIVRIDDKQPARILGLEDRIAPGQSATVAQQIRAMLANNAQAQLYSQALNELLEELRESATVRVFEENLTW